MLAATRSALIAGHFLRARWRWQALHGEALAGYQERRARRMVAFALQHSPFYRMHWQGHNPHDWRTLPTIDKQTMMDNFDRFTTRGIRKEAAMEVALQAERSRDFRPALGDLTVGLSSGTSGHRGLFLASPREQAAWAGTILARVLHRLPCRPLRVAFFLRSNSNLYEQVGSKLIRFCYFDLMLPLEQAIADLHTFAPQIVVGPPSLLGFLAEAQEDGRLHIQPERLISVAEVLEAQQRTRVHAAFEAPVHEIYQATEGLLAVSCERGSLHVQEDIVALQFEPLAGGERVMPIVTDLWRSTQPIIRYRLNDVLHLASGPCACGSAFRVIEAIEGRSDDICYFEALKGESRAFFPDTMRRMVLLASPAISEYRIVQRRDGSLSVQLAVEPGASFKEVAEDVQRSVKSTIEQYGCRPPVVQIEQGMTALAAGSKLRRVQRV